MYTHHTLPYHNTPPPPHPQYPWDIVKQAWELGLMNPGVPPECGGLGLGILDDCIIAEELAYGCTGIMTAMSANGLAVSGRVCVCVWIE